MDTRSGRIYDTSKPEEAFLLDVERELMRKQGLNPDEIIVPVSAADCAALEVKPRAKHSPYFTRRRRTQDDRKTKRQMARASRRANR